MGPRGEPFSRGQPTPPTVGEQWRVPGTQRLRVGVLTWASSALHTSCSLSGVMSTGTSNGEPSSWPPSSWNCTSSRCTSPAAVSSCGNKPGGSQSPLRLPPAWEPHAETPRPRPVRVHPPPQRPPSCVPTWRRSEAEGRSAAIRSPGSRGPQCPLMFGGESQACKWSHQEVSAPSTVSLLRSFTLHN